MKNWRLHRELTELTAFNGADDVQALRDILLKASWTSFLEMNSVPTFADDPLVVNLRLC
jgi:hypothetical protein